jgi:hypothetical protein
MCAEESGTSHDNQEQRRGSQDRPRLRFLVRLLDFVDRIRMLSKHGMIVFTLTLVPMLGYYYWHEYHWYTNPKELVFEDVKFRLFGGPQGTEVGVHVHKNGKVIFTSTCIGPGGSICRNNKFTKFHTAKAMYFTEIGPQTGIITSVTMDSQGGSDESYTNRDYETHIALYRQKIARKKKLSIFLLVIPFVTFLLSSFINFMRPKLFRSLHFKEI